MADEPQPQRRGLKAEILGDKLAAAMFLTRLVTIVSSLMFLLPTAGNSCYRRALLGAAVTSALRLQQRLPRASFSRQFLAQVLIEDSAHYLLFALIFLNSRPLSLTLLPLCLFSLLHSTMYLQKILMNQGPSCYPGVQSLLLRISSNQQQMLRLCALAETCLMPTAVFMCLSGQCSLFLPFFYYRFLTLRYASRRNPYCRYLFSELRLIVEQATDRPACPAFIRKVCRSAIGLISRLAPPVTP
uniref:transmembrane protein 33 n=1 Tax=Myxine glutinosa TaxID=7769 RepID=UPI00358F04CF